MIYFRPYLSSKNESCKYSRKRSRTPVAREDTAKLYEGIYRNHIDSTRIKNR